MRLLEVGVEVLVEQRLLVREVLLVPSEAGSGLGLGLRVQGAKAKAPRVRARATVRV